MHTTQLANDAARPAGAGVPAVELKVATRTRIRGRGYVMCETAGPRAHGAGPRRRETRYEAHAGLLVPFLALPAAPGGSLTGQGQVVTTPPGRYDWIYLRLAAHAEGDDEVWLHYENVAEPEWLRVPASAAAHVARVPVPRPDPLVAFRLPVRHRLEVLAITLAGPSADVAG